MESGREREGGRVERERERERERRGDGQSAMSVCASVCVRGGACASSVCM